MATNKKTSHIPCAVCEKVPTDRCHIKSKGAGGSLKDFNIINMCREHHVEQHKLGWNKFVQNHLHIMKILIEKGWELENVLGVWKLVRK